MVVRRRTRRFLVPFVLYGLSAGVVGYFLHHAYSGARGFDAKEKMTARVAEITSELSSLKAERAEWERRTALLRSDQIDGDLLEERARISLGYVHPNDVVIITQP